MSLPRIRESQALLRVLAPLSHWRAAALLLCVLLVSCPGPDGVELPTLSGSGSITFHAVQGAANPPAQTFMVTNTGGGALEGLTAGAPSYVGAATGWLTAGLTTSGNTATLTASVNIIGITAGMYGASVPISLAGATNSPQSLTVSLTVDPPPLISVPAGPLAFTAEQSGLNPVSQQITISNGGGGALSGIAVGGVSYPGAQQNWLQAPLLSGPNQGATLTIQPVTGTLPVGAHTAQVSLTAATAANNPQLVSIMFNVTQPVPTNLLVTAQPAGAVSGTAFTTQPAVRLRGSNNQPAAQANEVVTAALASGTGALGGTLTATTNAQGVATFANLSITGSGTHSLRFTATGLTPATSADFLVTVPPTIALPTGPVAFTAEAGGLDPAPQQVTITNAGDGLMHRVRVDSVRYGASEPGNWLPPSLLLSDTSAPANLTLPPITGSLAPGVYHASVSISATNAVNNPQLLPVTFTVTAPAPAALEIAAQPSGAVSGFALQTQPVVRLRGSNNQLVAQAGEVVTATRETGTGTLSGTITAITDAQGVATFTDLVITGTGNHSLRFSSGSLTPVVSGSFNAANAPSIQLASLAATFDATTGAANPAPQTIAITNGGGGTLAGLAVSQPVYGAGPVQSWLQPSANPQTAPATLTLSVTTGTLAAGSYTATIEVTGTGASNNPQTVTVTFNAAAAPAIALNQNALTFNATAGGGDPLAQTVTISNGGGGTLAGLTVGTITFGASQPTTWLAPARATIDVGTAPASLTIAPETGALAPGTYTATVPVTAAGAANSPQNVTVTFVVAAAPLIGLAQNTLSFAAAPGAANPPAQTIAVTNAGGGTLANLEIGTITFGASEPTGWLPPAQVTLDVTTAPATLTVSPLTGGLTAGTYTATVPVTAAGIANSPQNVTVTFVITANPIIALDATTLNFSATAGTGDPAAQTVHITNGGNGSLTGLAVGTITFGASQPTTWLAPARVTLDVATAPAVLTIAPQTGALVAGSYAATVPVTSVAAGNSPQHVTVNFEVAAAPAIALSAAAFSFAGTAGAADPASQTLTISNGGGGSLAGLSVSAVTYTPGQPINWLTVGTPSATTAPATVALHVTTAPLAPGTYAATFSVTGTAPNSPQPVTVTFVVAPAPPPNIALSATGITFSNVAEGGSNPSPGLIDVTNGGGGVLNGLSLGSITYGPGASNWLTGLLGAGTSPATMAFYPIIAGLPVGSYSATITLASSLPGVAPQTITVTLTIVPAPPPPALVASTNAVTFAGTVNGPDPAPIVLNLTGAGGTPAGLTSSQLFYDPAGVNWLNSELGALTAPTTLTLRPSVSGLAVGVYTVSVRVLSTTPGVFPTMITVALSVGPSIPLPSIALSPAVIAVSAQTGGASPANQQVQITNGGLGSLAGVSTGPVTDLSGQPVSWVVAGLSGATAPATLTLAFATGALGVGPHVALVPVLTSQPGVDPETVRVNLTVVASNPAGDFALSPASLTIATRLGFYHETSIALTNTGGTNVTGLVVDSIIYQGSPSDWLSTDLTPATTPAVLTVSTIGVETGTHQATIFLSGFASFGPSLLTRRHSLPVTLVVTDPQLAVSATNVSILPFPIEGSTTPVIHNNPVEITNAGSGLVTGLTVTGNSSPWLTPSLSSTTAPAILTLRADPTGLSFGSRDQYLTIGWDDPNQTTQSVRVNLRIQGFSLSPATVNVTARDGEAQGGPGVIHMAYEGSEPEVGAITYDAGEPTGWLDELLQCNFDCPPHNQSGELPVNARNLAQGTYHATVRVDGRNPGVGSKTFRVVLQVLPPSQPAIGVSTQQVSFSAPLGGANPAPIPVSITNIGAGQVTGLTAEFDPAATWLSASFTSSVAPSTMTLSANVASLQPGAYSTDLSVQSPDVSFNQLITVTTIVPVAPLIVLSTDTLTFGSGPGGTNPPSRTIQITAGPAYPPPAPLTGLRIDSIHYITPGTGWLTAGLSGTTAPATLRVQPVTGTLADGTYVADIYLSSPVAPNSPRVVRDTFRILPPAIGLATNAITLSGNTYPSVSVGVTNAGGAPLTGLLVDAPAYQEATFTGWLAASLPGTSAPTSLQLSATSGSLPPGVYHALVVVRSSVATITPRTLTVTFENPGIQLSRVTSAFPRSVSAGSSTLIDTITISNSGPGVLGFLSAGVSAGATGWLSASVSGNNRLVISVSAGSLPVGTHNGTVTVSAPVAGNAPTIAVSYTISTSLQTHLRPIFESTSFTAGCANSNCHTGASNRPAPDLLSPDVYLRLVNVLSACNGAMLVVPGRTDLSHLLRKVSPPTGSPPNVGCGVVMPTGGQNASIQNTIAAWIREGAPNN